MKQILQLLFIGYLGLIASINLQGNSFQTIDYISIHYQSPDSEAFGVSTDGTVVVGQSTTSSTSNHEQAFRWTVEGDMVGLGYLKEGRGNESIALGCSEDGSVVVGYSFQWDPNYRAFQWTEEKGMQELGDLPGGDVLSRAYGVSADGSVIVGESVATSGMHGFIWTTETGMQPIMDLTGEMGISTARAVSADGTVVVGQSTSEFGKEAFRLLGDQIQGLGDLPGGIYESIALAVSADGKTIVGYGSSGSPNRKEAFRWTEKDGMTGLGRLEGSDWTNSEARDVSADGNTVVGVYGSTPFIWDPVNGMRNLKGVLEQDYGLNLGRFDLLSANAISDDGRVIVGRGRSTRAPRAWVAEIVPKVPNTTWIFSGPVRQNDVNSEGSPYPDMLLEDTMYGTFSIGQTGSYAEFTSPGIYSFFGLGIESSVGWEDQVISSLATSSPTVVVFRDNDVPTPDELAMINFYLGTYLPENSQFDIAQIKSNKEQDEVDREFGVIFVSQDLNLISGFEYRQFPSLDQVDLAIFYVNEAYLGEMRFTASGLVSEWHRPVQDITITGVSYAGNILNIYFTSTPGVKSWDLKSGKTLKYDLTDDLTDYTTTHFFESSGTPGNYVAEADISILLPRSFFRIEK